MPKNKPAVFGWESFIDSAPIEKSQTDATIAGIQQFEAATPKAVAIQQGLIAQAILATQGRSVSDIAKDTALDVGIGGSLALADLGNFAARLNVPARVINAVGEKITGIDASAESNKMIGAAREYWAKQHSEGQQAQQKEFAGRTEKGVVGTVESLKDNPAVLTTILGEQVLPTALTMGGATALRAAGAGAKALGAFGIGSEMAQSAGDTTEQSIRGGASEGRALAAGAQSALVTGLIGKVLGDGLRLANAVGADGTAYSKLGRVADIGIREPLSEAAQEVLADNAAQNMATGKGAFDNWAESAVLGAAAGVSQSAGMQGIGAIARPTASQATNAREAATMPITDVIDDIGMPSQNGQRYTNLGAITRPAVATAPTQTKVVPFTQQGDYVAGSEADPIRAREPVAEPLNPGKVWTADAQGNVAEAQSVPTPPVIPQLADKSNVWYANQDGVSTEPLNYAGKSNDPSIQIAKDLTTHTKNRDDALKVINAIERNATDAVDLSRRRNSPAYQNALNKYAESSAQVNQLAQTDTTGAEGVQSPRMNLRQDQTAEMMAQGREQAQKNRDVSQKLGSEQTPALNQITNDTITGYSNTDIKEHSLGENTNTSGENLKDKTQNQKIALKGNPIDQEWSSFSNESGSLNIPRAQMPQIKAEHRGAMINFMNARGISHKEETISAAKLKPTQAEFSNAKVEKAKTFEGGNRSILVSKDNHVLDGHHQWLAAHDKGEDVKVIRLDAPIQDLLTQAHDFPSSTVDKSSSPTTAPQALQSAPATLGSRPAKSNPRPDSSQDTALEFIAKHGGIDPSDQQANDLRVSIGAEPNKNVKIVGIRNLFAGKGRGMKLDDAARLLMQHGYLDSHDAQALLNKLHDNGDYHGHEYDHAADYAAGQQERAPIETAADEHQFVNEYIDAIDDEFLESIPFELNSSHASADLEAWLNENQGTTTQPTQSATASDETKATRNDGAGTPPPQNQARENSDFALSSETNAQTLAREQGAQRQAEQERQRNAAPSADEFNLSGSSRDADVAAANGAQDLFASTVQHSTVEFPTKRITESYRHISTSPHGAGKAEMERFERSVQGVTDEAKPLIETEAQQTAFDTALDNFKQGYIREALKLASVREGTVSSHVAGRNNFNGKQAARTGGAYEKAQDVFSTWLENNAPRAKSAVLLARTSEQLQAADAKAETAAQQKAILSFARQAGYIADDLRNNRVETAKDTRKTANPAMEKLLDGMDEAQQRQAIEQVDKALQELGGLVAVVGVRSNLGKRIAAMNQPTPVVAATDSSESNPPFSPADHWDKVLTMPERERALSAVGIKGIFAIRMGEKLWKKVPEKVRNDLELHLVQQNEAVNDDLRNNDIKQSRSPKARAAEWLSVLSKVSKGEAGEGMFQNPIAPKSQQTLREVAATVSRNGIQVSEPLQDDGNGDVNYFLKMPDGSTATMVETKSGEVFVDASQLHSTTSKGSLLYSIVGNYAFNTGKVFIGDPAGLSVKALFRRTEQMASLALKFGTTKFMRPHPKQEGKGFGMADEAAGEALATPLHWSDNDAENFQNLLETSYANTVALAPEIKNVSYDFEHRQFVDGSGNVVDDLGFTKIAQRSARSLRERGLGFLTSDVQEGESTISTRGLVGSASLKTAALYQSLGRESSSEVSGRSVLDQISRQLRRDGLDPALSGIRYSESSEPATSQHTIESIRTDLIAANPATARLIQNGKLQIVQSVAELPADIRQSVDGETQAFYDPQTRLAYIVADGLQDDAYPVLLHELGHASKEEGGIFGTQAKVLNKILDQASTTKALREAVDERLADAGLDESHPDYAEERLMYAVEEAAQRDDIGSRSFTRRALDALRAFYVKAALKFGLPTKLTEKDLYRLAEAELKRMANARDPSSGNPNGGIKQSKAKAEKTTSDTEIWPDKAPNSTAHGVTQSYESSTRIMASLSEAGNHVFSSGLNLIPTHHLVQMYQDWMPSLKAMRRYGEKMFGRQNSLLSESDKVLQRMYKGRKQFGQKKMDALAGVMHSATVWGIDPSQKSDARWTYEWRAAHGRLQAQYKALPTELQQLFVDVRDHYTTRSEQLKDALKQQVEDMLGKNETASKIMTELQDEYDRRQEDGVYFPLSRFGEYVVTADKGEIVMRAETQIEAEEMTSYLQLQGYKDARHFIEKVDLSSESGISTQFVKKMRDNIVSKLGEDSTVAQAMLDELNQLFIEYLPNQSSRKNMIHRKNRAGYSNDIVRSFSRVTTNMARDIANMEYSQKISEALQKADKEGVRLSGRADQFEARRVVNHFLAMEKAELTHKNSAVVRGLNAAGFIGTMAWNLSSGVVNLTQVPILGYPYLAARFGDGAAFAELMKSGLASLKSAKLDNYIFDATRGFAASSDEGKALADLEALGKRDMSAMMEIVNASNRNSATFSQFYNATEKAMLTASIFMRASELLNRDTMAIASYRLARKGSSKRAAMSHEQAVNFAALALDETQVDTSRQNKAGIQRSNLGQAALLFKTFAINFMALMGRNMNNALRGATPAERSEAQGFLLRYGAMQGLAAGALGVPLWVPAGLLGGAIGKQVSKRMGKSEGFGTAVGATLGMALMVAFTAGLFDDDDEPDWKAKMRSAMRQLAEKITGDEVTMGAGDGNPSAELLADVLSKGLPSLLGLDISSRISGNDLLFRFDDNPRTTSVNQFTSLVMSFMGTIGIYGNKIAGAIDAASDGQHGKAIERLLPTAAANPIKAVRQAVNGVTTAQGLQRPVEFGVYDFAVQAGGFRPAGVARELDYQNDVRNMSVRLGQQQADIKEAWANAHQMTDPEARAAEKLAVIKRAQQFNEGKTIDRLTRKELDGYLKSRHRQQQTLDGTRKQPRSMREAEAALDD